MKYLYLLSIFLFSITISHGSADLRKQVYELATEKRNLTMQVGKLFRKHKLDEKQEYQDAQQKAYQASVAYSKARKNHPKLKELYEKNDAAQSKMIKAQMAKDDAAAKEARKEFMNVRMEIEKVSRDIPELQELQKAAIKAGQESQKVELDLLATTDEGKPLVEKIRSLESKIAALQKQMVQ